MARKAWFERLSLVAVLVNAAFSSGCAAGTGGAGAPSAAALAPPNLKGAWRITETASRAPGENWRARPGPQAGLYVFSARHYSYSYVPGVQPRVPFADTNRPTEVEKAGAYDSFIAGAGSYTFDGHTLELFADLRKNPNEMTGGVWRWQAVAQGDTLRLVFVDPPFLPGSHWRITLVRVE